MSHRQASREHAVGCSHLQRAVDRNTYITARSTELSPPCSSCGFYTCNHVCLLHLLSPLFDLCLCSVGEALQPKRRGPRPLVDESALIEWLEREREQGGVHTRNDIISQASRMYNDRLRTDDTPSSTLTVKSMAKWWRLFLHRHPEVSGRLAQHDESVRLDKTPMKDVRTTWFNKSLGPALANVGYDQQYVFNEDELGMFIDFDTSSLK